MTAIKDIMYPPGLLELLGRPECYPDQPTTVTAVETHISWVFLTDRYAYKVKKPVRFEFLDFSTLELRRQACLDELRLNRRLAPDVYLKVVPITADRRGNWHVDGTTTPIEWAVKMRRLAADQTLQQRIRNGQLRSEDTQRIAAQLARFYTQAAPLTVKPEEYRAGIEQHVRANFSELSRAEHGAPAQLVRRAHAAQLRFLRLGSELLDRRVCDGRIVEGHGDLRPEHIYLERPPVIIDCVEFNADLRKLDVADELSFLAMECDRLGAEDVGRQVLATYAEASGDRPDSILLDFYKCYRACVRAKVDALRSDQLPTRERPEMDRLVDEYLALASRYADGLGPPPLIVVGGLMGTGKSTLAQALSEALGAELLRTDVIRRELFPSMNGQAPYGEGVYGEQHRAQVYDELLTRARQALTQGLSVVLDGTFLSTESRAQAAEMARQTAATCLAVRCQCPPEIAKQRIAERLVRGDGPSDARPDLFQQQQLEEQPDPPGMPNLVVDTTTGLAAQVNDVLQVLKPQVICMP